MTLVREQDIWLGGHSGGYISRTGRSQEEMFPGSQGADSTSHQREGGAGKGVGGHNEGL